MSTTTTPSAIHLQNYRYLQQHVHSQTGIVLENDKHYLFESRLAPIVRQHGLGSINDLCALLQATSPTSDLSRLVSEAMTTNETYFFRDPAQYDAIRKVLLPRLKVEHADTRKLRFWSAAASTGQEAYSLAMALMEDGYAGWNVQILGTDYSSQVLERARSGQYQQLEINRGLPASLLVKHFHRNGHTWQVNDPLRKIVTFERLDLRKSLRAFGPFDLVFCRNIMIYFDAATKRKIIQEIHGTLFRGGWLLLGGSETAFGVDEWFDKQDVNGVTVYVAR